MTAVRRALALRRAKFTFLNQESLLNTTLRLWVDRDSGGILHTEGQDIALDDVRAFYLRPFDTLCVAAVSSSAPSAQATAVGLEYDLLRWANIATAVVVNRPDASASNASKPYQLDLIRNIGFSVPRTVLTTSKEEVRAFQSVHGAVIFKSVSGIRSVVAPLEDSSHLDNLDTCPVQFQEYVPGVDVRVHVVGDEVFACKIEADGYDYRYASGRIEMRPYQLATDVADLCRRVTSALGLQVAGVDLRRRDDGTWYCFEVNPSPGFTAFSVHTGQPIADAIATLLMRS